MIGVIKTIFFLLVFFYVARFISRVLVPFFRAVTDINQRQKQSEREQSFVQYTEKKKVKNKPSDDDGEYVDYKEVN